MRTPDERFDDGVDHHADPASLFFHVDPHRVDRETGTEEQRSWVGIRDLTSRINGFPDQQAVSTTNGQPGSVMMINSD